MFDPNETVSLLTTVIHPLNKIDRALYDALRTCGIHTKALRFIRREQEAWGDQHGFPQEDLVRNSFDVDA